MASYKGVEVADDLVALLHHMDHVDHTREALQRLQAVWDHLALLCQLSGTGVEIAGVREAFAALTSRLIDQLAGEARRKAAARLQTQAQIAIDILVRNLFERTADIGFLATDSDLRQFAETEAAARDAALPALTERLREYQRKYSVYEDIVLLDLQGRVLARLGDDGANGVAATRSNLVADALQSRAAYVETFAPIDLMPGAEPSLVYSYRVMAADGHRAVAVLCLCFRFADECRRIFRDLRGADDWSVLALLDAGGAVIASSDVLQVPVGPTLPLSRAAGSRQVRFGGRRWLASTCAAHAYQGYAGPGWFGHAMLPLEHAFRADADGLAADADVPASMRRALAASPLLCSATLREVERSAGLIEAELRRAVWNGNVTLATAAADRDSAFSKILLREIGQTGALTREIFSGAIADINRTVLSAVLDDAGARAALAIDIMDRNLYERANDCRWWALTAAFRHALDAERVDAATGAALGAVLQTIHGLYTVYANLLLFDRAGRIVAVSRADEHAAPGRLLEAEWVARTLALGDAQAYAVSEFEATPLYAGAPTFVYTAAVRGPGDGRRVVGGIAIVFDAGPQFQAMLADTLPRDEAGRVPDGAFNLFVDRRGRVIANSQAEPAVGAMLAAADLATAARSTRGARIVPWQGRLCAVGHCASTGYREYKGDGDAYRHEVSALGFVALTDAAAADAREPPPHPESGRRSGGAAHTPRVDLATFLVAGQWYALASADVAGAVAAQRILPLPSAAAHVRGSVMHHGVPVLVLDLAHLLGGAPARHAGAAQIVIVKPGAGRSGFGLVVDALGSNPDVECADLEPLGGPASLIAQLVKSPGAPAGQDLLKVLSLPRLCTAAFGSRAAVPVG